MKVQQDQSTSTYEREIKLGKRDFKVGIEYQTQDFKAGIGYQTQDFKAGIGYQMQDFKAGIGYQTQDFKAGIGYQTQDFKAGIGYQTQDSRVSFQYQMVSRSPVEGMSRLKTARIVQEPTSIAVLSAIATGMRQLQDAQTKVFQKRGSTEEPEPVKPGVSVLPTLKGPDHQPR